MNQTYRIVWNESTQSWVVTHERAKGRSKSSVRSPSRLAAVATVLLSALAGGAALAAPPAPTELPTGGQVVAGQAAIASSAATMTITQSTAKAIVNWNTFNIGANATVNVLQQSASSVLLNRVTGPDPSAIYGRLNAVGQVFLVNPNGVLFAPGARVDVGGLVASTMNISNDNFMSGNYRFNRDGSTGSVVNQGELSARYVAMLAPEVRNEGVVVASMGTAAMAAGESVTLGITGQDLVTVQVEKAAVDTLVENKHLIRVDGGTAVLSAQSVNALLGSVVNTGAIEANGIETGGGVIRLTASSNIDHSGSMSANAGSSGAGGTVLAIADLDNTASRTVMDGTISAKGGSNSGNGGFVETSASTLKIGANARVNTTAQNGRAGQWLLDPTDFTVAATGGDMTGATLSANLGTGDVIIQSGTGASGTNGDVFVNDTVSWSANTLTLRASRDVNVNSTMDATGTAGLAVEYGQGAAAAGNSANFTVNAPVNMASTSALSTKLGSDGTVKNYTIVTTLAGLTGIDASAASVQLNYALGSNFALSGNWTPLGKAVGPFDGTFDGLGHTISGLQNASTATEQIGFFGLTGSSARVQNVGLTGVNLTGRSDMGGLVGVNEGTIYNAYTTGTIALDSGVGGTANVYNIGGLTGNSGGNILRSWSSVNISAAGGDQSGGVGGGGGIGGLVGQMRTGLISNSYATGAVAGGRNVGGLVGEVQDAITNSYATGAVSGTTNVGGLLGNVLTGTLSGNFWDTTTSGQATGVGANAGTGAPTGMSTADMKIAANFNSATTANGNVNPAWDTRFWKLANGAYPQLGTSAGAVASGPRAITINLDNSTRVYGDTAQPTLTGFGYTGTLLSGDTLTGAGWGSALTNTLDAGVYAYSTANLILPTFTYSGHSASDYTVSYSANNLTVTKANLVLSGSRTYDGTTAVAGSVLTATGAFGQTFNVTGAGDASNLATKNANATAQTLQTVTNLALGTSGNGGNASNYNVLGTAGSTVTITPASLTLAGSTGVNRTYDGTTNLAGGVNGYGTLGGTVFGSDNVMVLGTAAYDSKNAGSRIVQQGTVALFGTDASNYQLNWTNGSGTIAKAALTLAGSTGVNRGYDATTAMAAGVTGYGTLGGTVFGTDNVSVAGAAVYDSKNAGSRTVQQGTVALDGTDKDNYLLNWTNGSGTIARAGLTLAGATGVDRTYNATTSMAAGVTGYGTLGGTVFGTDNVSVTGAAVYDSKNAGSRTVQQGTVALGGTDKDNYQLNWTNGSGTIAKASLNIGGSTGIDKIYDATTAMPSGVTGYGAMSGLFSGDAVTLSGSTVYDSKDAGSRTVLQGTVAISGGASQNNYQLAWTNGSGTISPKALTVLGLSSGNISALQQLNGDYRVTAGTYTLNGTPALNAAQAAGTGTTSDGNPYAVDGPLTFTGQATGSLPSSTGAAPRTALVSVTGLTLNGTGSSNYTLTGNSVSARIEPSKAIQIPDPIVTEGVVARAARSVSVVQNLANQLSLDDNYPDFRSMFGGAATGGTVPALTAAMASSTQMAAQFSGLTSTVLTGDSSSDSTASSGTAGAGTSAGTGAGSSTAETTNSANQNSSGRNALNPPGGLSPMGVSSNRESPAQ